MSKKNNSGDGKSQDASTSDTSGDASAKDSNADIYENRGPKKIIRVVTVMAYMFSVSFVGILLSAYYIFLWEPPNPRLVQREHLQADPQMHFLIAEKTDPTKKDGSFLLQSEVDPIRKPLLNRMMLDMHEDDSAVDHRDRINLESKRRLNAVLMKLRHSLVGIQRAQKQNSSRETMYSGDFNNSFVEKVLNSTMDRAKNTFSRYVDSRANLSEEKTHRDNADLPVEFIASESMPDVESMSSTSTIPKTETSQKHFDGDSVTNINSFIGTKNRYRKKNLDAVPSHLVRGFSNVMTSSNVTNGSDRRVFADGKVNREFLKFNSEERTKQNKTDDRQLINNARENDSDGVQTSVILEGHVNGGIRNFRENYFIDSSSNEQIAREGVTIDQSRDSVLTDDLGFRQTPDDLTIVKSRPRTTGTRNFKDTQIERVTARSTTIDNRLLEQIDSSTTQRHKSFSEIANVERTSVELTSISTTRDYHNFTSVTSENGENVT